MTEHERILQAFDLEQPSYRTVGGIARSTGLQESVVKDFIDRHPELFEISPIRPAGILGYRLTRP